MRSVPLVAARGVGRTGGAQDDHHPSGSCCRLGVRAGRGVHHRHLAGPRRDHGGLHRRRCGRPGDLYSHNPLDASLTMTAAMASAGIGHRQRGRCRSGGAESVLRGSSAVRLHHGSQHHRQPVRRARSGRSTDGSILSPDGRFDGVNAVAASLTSRRRDWTGQAFQLGSRGRAWSSRWPSWPCCSSTSSRRLLGAVVPWHRLPDVSDELQPGSGRGRAGALGNHVDRGFRHLVAFPVRHRRCDLSRGVRAQESAHQLHRTQHPQPCRRPVGGVRPPGPGRVRPGIERGHRRFVGHLRRSHAGRPGGSGDRHHLHRKPFGPFRNRCAKAPTE